MKERCQVINTHYFTTLHDSTSPPLVLSCCSWITAHRGTFFQVAKPLSLYHEAYLSFPKLTLIPWLECVCTCAMLRKRSISILMILSEALGECLHLLKPKFHKHTSANDCTFPEQAQGRLTLHAITVYFYNRLKNHPPRVVFILIGATLDTSTFLWKRKADPFTFLMYIKIPV